VHIVMCIANSGKDNRFKQAFAGRTQEGVAIGSSREEVLRAYGEPTKTEKPEGQPGTEIMRYRKQGLFIRLRDGKVDSLGVIFRRSQDEAKQAGASTPHAEASDDYFETPFADSPHTKGGAASPVDRTIFKEPSYEAAPKYSLLTLGNSGDVRVWMVEDGKRLFVDKNANGDLTDDGPPLMPSNVRNLDATRWDFDYVLDTITSTNGSRHTQFVLRRWNYNDHEDSYGLSLSVDGQMPMYAGWFGTFWSTNREKTPVIRFSGPFTPTLLRRKEFTIGEKGQRLSLGFFHGGSDPGAESRLSIDALPQSIVPELTIEWPTSASTRPLRTSYELTQRCCYWEFYTTEFEVPKGVVAGSAKVSLHLPAGGIPIDLTTTKMEVPVVSK